MRRSRKYWAMAALNAPSVTSLPFSASDSAVMSSASVLISRRASMRRRARAWQVAVAVPFERPEVVGILLATADEVLGRAQYEVVLSRQAPARLHVILASRHDPPFPVQRMRGRGQVLDLRGPQLAFTLEEVESAVRRLAATNSGSAVIKLNNGFSGQGNAIVSYHDLGTTLVESPTVFCAEEESWPTFGPKIVAEGAIREEGTSYHYLPPDEHGGQTMDELRHHIDSDNLLFGLLLGDQIYADSAERKGIHRIAVTLEEYRALYEHAWYRPAMRGLLPGLPLFMILDDNEVDDDWHWLAIERSRATIPVYIRFFRWLKGLPPEQRRLSPERVRAALKAYVEHQAMHAPELALSDKTSEPGKFLFQSEVSGCFAYKFYFGGAAFFVLDTRTMRVKDSNASLLGEEQWIILQKWLKEVNGQYPVKFLVSSGTILHPFWLDVARDRWSGFPVERERLLEFLASNEIEGLHILTGDLHSAHAIFAEGLRNVAAGALHLDDTGFPWEAGSNVYIAGHRLGYPRTKSWLVFWNLNKLKRGNKIVLKDAKDRRYEYEVFDREVVGPHVAEHALFFMRASDGGADAVDDDGLFHGLLFVSCQWSVVSCRLTSDT